MSELLRMANKAAIADGGERDDALDAFCQSLWDQDGEIQCKTKRGTPTRRVTLTAQVTP